jgi:predicted ATPase
MTLMRAWGAIVTTGKIRVKGLCRSAGHNIPSFCVQSQSFQAAAFSLIPVEDRAHFQLQIGRTLRGRLSEEGFEDNILLIASLMMQGSDHVESEDEREKLSRLCVAAARKAAKSSAFSVALQYIGYGMTLLTRRHWRDQYDLSLVLYSAGCELAYCNGDHGTVNRWHKEVIDNARGINDKLQVYVSLILSLDARWQLGESKDLCLEFLHQCGQLFPRKVTKLGVYRDFCKTRRMLRGKRIHDILNLSPMTDRNALNAMSIIHLLYPIVLFVDIKLAPLTAFRLVRLTLEHGISSMSKSHQSLA